MYFLHSLVSGKKTIVLNKHIGYKLLLYFRNIKCEKIHISELRICNLCAYICLPTNHLPVSYSSVFLFLLYYLREFLMPVLFHGPVTLISLPPVTSDLPYYFQTMFPNTSLVGHSENKVCLSGATVESGIVETVDLVLVTEKTKVLLITMRT